MVTEVPISGLYNLPSWNEALYLDNVGYSQNRISDAMTFAATVTPLKGWDIIGEMKVRFDVQNDEFLQKQPRTTRPDGTIEYPLPGRDILIPVSNIRILCGDQ